jgi:SAM-dependent methyltransferase
MGSSDPGLPGHAERNREVWTAAAAEYAAAGERAWAEDEISWGIYGVPEAEVGALAGIELEGADVVELGCGTAYVSAWLARRGARPVGVDVTPAQLETARRLQREHGLEFPLHEASAEDVPLPDESFDLAISEYGASLWCDPDRWIAEAARLLRPGGRLVFLTNGLLAVLCMPDEGPIDERLRRPYRDMRRFEWPGDDEGVEFHLGWGDWVRLLRRHGFELEDYLELYAPEGASTRYEWANDEWARHWPVEEIWKARKRS